MKHKVVFLICCWIPAALFAQELGYKSLGNEGMVAASEKAPVQAGLDMLEAGGTAADAAVAVILAESVVDFPRFNIGGEVTFMFYDAESQKVKVLSGVGEAPLSKEGIDWYMKNGIPEDDIRAALVPSVIDLCVKALQLYGRLSFEETVAPTLKLLESGSPVSSTIRYSLSEVSQDTGWYGGLARTLRKLVEAEQQRTGSREEKLQAVADRFYRGDVADSLAAWYRSTGSFFTKEDLAQHVTEVEEPVSINYKGFTVYKANTWTQGPVMLQALRLIENFDLQAYGYLSPEYIHVVTEALKLSFADRDTYYGDPLFVEVPLKELLSDEYTRLRAPLINMDLASDECRPGDPVGMQALLGKGEYLKAMGGTTVCSVMDKWGNMVAASPSGWGSKAGNGGSTGVTHGTRLKSFNTLEGHPNCIAPGKRPRVTLSPTIVLKDGKPFLAMCAEGGDTQDQNQLNLFLAIAEFGISPYDALTIPRFNTNLFQGSFNPSSDRHQALPQNRILSIREGLSIERWRRLADLGHTLQLDENKVNIGHPAIIYVDPGTGQVHGATDPSTARFTGAIRSKEAAF
ncbi:gamma-glutamyltransferase family protein [Negadavirga shengliensis]|uniref:Gamma-glutamyltransferase family protein n=1 Tax=Negadavirga shengliensis TaxID=1389218 RepID=A0ABV9SXF0_9BACT